MANVKNISRLMMLINRIKRGDYPNFLEIKEYVENKGVYSYDGLNKFSMSNRTLQRDLQDIRTVFGIDICYNRAEKGYYISSTKGENFDFMKMLETHDVFQLLNASKQLKKYIFAENSKPKGTIYFNDILHAIKNGYCIKIAYKKFYKDDVEEREIAPYALKESAYRWYLIAKYNTHIVTYALDRICDLEVTRNSFNYPKDFDVNELYKDTFGISMHPETDSETVILSMSQFQAKYFDSLPLHSSQKLISETDSELQYSLQVKITDEFIYKIISYGNRIKVLKPKSLINELKYILEEMCEQYDLHENQESVD